MLVLKYLRLTAPFSANQLSDTILRIVFAIEPGIRPGGRKLVSGNLLRGKRGALHERSALNPKNMLVIFMVLVASFPFIFNRDLNLT